MSSSSHKSLAESGKRSFTINNVYHIDGCPTKFTHKDYTGRYEKHSAQRAASEAITNLCAVKKIRGQCTLYIEMRETTAGSKKKLYAYHGKRVHLKEPLELSGRTLYYENVITPVKHIPVEKCEKSHKSSGKMVGYQSGSRSSHNSVNRSYKSKHHTKKKEKTFSNKISNTVKGISKMFK